jgi:chromate transport protein ChrA
MELVFLITGTRKFVHSHSLVAVKTLLLNVGLGVRVVVFNATFNNISVILWQSFFYWWIKMEYRPQSNDVDRIVRKCYQYITMDISNRHMLPDLDL